MIDSKLRGCDLVKIKIRDVVAGPEIRARAIVIQQKTGRPVQFEITSDVRASLLVWLERRGGTVEDYAFPSRIDNTNHMSTRLAGSCGAVQIPAMHCRSALRVCKNFSNILRWVMPFLDIDEALVSNFRAVLDNPAPKGRQKEQVVQDFLEAHTELIPTPNLLNHHLQLNSIVSKFPLSPALITDYVYLTKSSGLWKITLVELESPDKDIFTTDMRRAVPTAAFTGALAQVIDWKSYIEDNRAVFLERLKPLVVPLVMRGNPVAFEYQLIIGRSPNKNLSAARLRYLEQIRQSGIDVLTYDTLIGYYGSSSRYRKNVMRASGSRFAFKSMLPSLPHIFAHLGPAELELSAEQEARLIKEGYELDKWKAGELLTVNGKLAASSDRPFGILGLGS